MPDHPLNASVRLLDGEFYAQDPHPHLLWMRDNAPVYWDPAGAVWGIALYEDVMTVAKNPSAFSNSGGIRPDAPAMPYMIDLDDPEHKRRRNLVNRGFTVRRVSEREPRIREICVDRIERARALGRFDFVKDVAAWLPLIVIGDMLGVEPDAHDDLLRWSDDLIRGSGATDAARVDCAAAAFADYNEYMARVLADRRSKPPQDDLISILAHAEIDGQRLDDEAILMESLLILIGGDETTRHVISGGMYELAQHPDQRRQLTENPDLLPGAVEEMLRWVSPIQNMARTATRDVRLRDQTIRQGDKLLLLYPSANRDAAVFDDPFQFDVCRTPNEHVAFGYGAHFCLGASLARLELRVMFQEIMQRLPDMQLVGERPPKRASNFICGFETMPAEIR